MRANGALYPTASCLGFEVGVGRQLELMERLELFVELGWLEMLKVGLVS